MPMYMYIVYDMTAKSLSDFLVSIFMVVFYLLLFVYIGHVLYLPWFSCLHIILTLNASASLWNTTTFTYFIDVLGLLSLNVSMAFKVVIATMLLGYLRSPVPSAGMDMEEQL